MAPDLNLGPLLRYAGESDATVWVETDAACEVGVLGHAARTFEIEGHHYALVQITDLEPGETYEYEVSLDGTKVWPDDEHDFPPSVIRTIAPDGELNLSYGSCRVAVPHEPPFTLAADANKDGYERCPSGSGPAHDARGPRKVARRAATAGGSDLRRRGLSGRPRFHPLAARHERGARRAGRRLRGVHAPVLGLMEGPGHKVAPVDRADGDDLRRPRRQRRLEHLGDLGPSDAKHTVVGGAHHGGFHVLLGVSAPRQPLPARAGGGWALREGAGGREPDPRPARVRLRGGPRDRRYALELPPRLRQGPSHHDGLASGARTEGGPPRHAR